MSRRDLATEVAPGLWVGGAWQPYPRDRTWDVVVTVCQPWEAVDEPPAGRAYSVPMLDWWVVDQRAVDATADAVRASLAAGRSTLVRCAAGLNRSALVAGVALVGHTGDAPADVIATMRRRRSRHVLHNEVFEAYLLDLA